MYQRPWAAGPEQRVGPDAQWLATIQLFIQTEKNKRVRWEEAGPNKEALLDRRNQIS